MPLIEYCRAVNSSDLQGILALQSQNLPAGLSEEERRREGFVTVMHDLPVLETLNTIEPHIVARKNNQVIAYILTMTAQSSETVPLLIPMFEKFRNISYRNSLISEAAYVVVGQVCVQKEYRRMGILDACYAFYRQQLEGRYAFAITEIDRLNHRSIQAHARIGFKEVGSYRSASRTDWSIVLWPWH